MKISILTYDEYETESGSLTVSNYGKEDYYIGIKGKDDLDISVKIKSDDLKALIKALTL